VKTEDFPFVILDFSFVIGSTYAANTIAGSDLNKEIKNDK